MKVFDIFSKREKRRRGEVHDVYEHEDIPEPLRNQGIHIWKDVFGPPIHDLIGGLSYPPAYEFIHDVLCREHAKRTLYACVSNAYGVISLKLFGHLTPPPGASSTDCYHPHLAVQTVQRSFPFRHSVPP